MMEIVERSSGYWIVDMSGVIDGPFEDRNYALASLMILLNEEARTDIDKLQEEEEKQLLLNERFNEWLDDCHEETNLKEKRIK